MNILLILSLSFQVVTLSLALYKFKNFKAKFILPVTAIFFLSVVTEFFGLLRLGKLINGINVHYLYTGLLFNVIYLFYARTVESIVSLKIMKVLTIVFSILWLYAYFDSRFFHSIIILGSCNTVIYAFIYLKELLMSDRIVNFKKMLPFWVSVAFLVFYLPSIPFFSMLNYMKTRGLFFVLYILIILRELILIYGLLCSKKEKKF